MTVQHVAIHPEGGLNILSICTGGGGLDLGIELAVPSARSVCMVEREAYAVAQLVSAMEAGHLAPAPIWSDARTFNGRAWRGAVDGLIGGIPCQPHSLAGRKGGSNDPRDLWSNARRIIVQSRAWFVVIENVGGMLSAGDDEVAGAQRVWRDLSKLGFEVEGGLFTAAEVGAPHQRERIFILAVAAPTDDSHRGGPQSPEKRLAGGHTLNLQDQVQGFQASAWPTPTSRDHRSVHASEGTHDRNARPLSEAVGLWYTPNVPNGGRSLSPDTSPTGKTADGIKRQVGLENQANWWMTPRSHEVGQYQYSRGDKTKPVQTLTGQAFSHQDPVIYPVGGIPSKERRSLNPLFVEWLMGWPPGWTLLAWTDLGCSATELSAWKARMRSALLSLGLPQEAPPAQLTLFG